MKKKAWHERVTQIGRGRAKKKGGENTKGHVHKGKGGGGGQRCKPAETCKKAEESLLRAGQKRDILRRTTREQM